MARVVGGLICGLPMLTLIINAMFVVCTFENMVGSSLCGVISLFLCLKRVS